MNDRWYPETRNARRTFPVMTITALIIATGVILAVAAQLTYGDRVRAAARGLSEAEQTQVVALTSSLPGRYTLLLSSVADRDRLWFPAAQRNCRGATVSMPLRRQFINVPLWQAGRSITAPNAPAANPQDCPAQINLISTGEAARRLAEDSGLSAPARLVLSATLEQELNRRAQEGARYASQHLTLPPLKGWDSFLVES